MIPTAIIAFREFFEAFLLVGIFLGIDKGLKLHRRKEIIFAVLVGVLFSLVLPCIVFLLSADMLHLVTEKTADTFEGFLLVFAGVFLAYVVFTLHAFLHEGKMQKIFQTKEKIEKEIFDMSLFLTIVLFIAREGLEIALLVATTSLFVTFWSNMFGLLLGFFLAGAIGLAVSFAYIKIPIKKVFVYTEYLIVIIGAAMIKNGISLLLNNFFRVDLGKIFPLPLHFLPSETTMMGHSLYNVFGVEQHMGVVQVLLMCFYITFVWLVLKTHKVPHTA